MSDELRAAAEYVERLLDEELAELECSGAVEAAAAREITRLRAEVERLKMLCLNKPIPEPTDTPEADQD